MTSINDTRQHILEQQESDYHYIRHELKKQCFILGTTRTLATEIFTCVYVIRF
jgi:hypothetical protein